MGLEYSDTPSANEVKVFYVTYNVINYQLVQANEGKTDIDVSTISETSGSYYLDMFYYADVYSIVGGETYNFISNEDGNALINVADETARKVAADLGFATGDKIIITAGFNAKHGITNTIRILELK